jgi:hypothetical protein
MEFSQTFLHLGKLSAAADNSGLRNRMASYTTDQEVFTITTFYSSGGACVGVGRQHRPELFVRAAPSRGTTYWITEQLEETESVCVCV